VRYALTAVLAVAMGIQNATATRLAVPELTTTVLTKTLTGLAAEADHSGPLRARRVIAVTAMLLGALCGGLLALHASVAAALAPALALAVAVALAAHVLSRTEAPWSRPSEVAAPKGSRS
jgi:uncharacterized membrane protein YoaK (UPF0700 family)